MHALAVTAFLLATRSAVASPLINNSILSESYEFSPATYTKPAVVIISLVEKLIADISTEYNKVVKDKAAFKEWCDSMDAEKSADVTFFAAKETAMKAKVDSMKDDLGDETCATCVTKKLTETENTKSIYEKEVTRYSSLIANVTTKMKITIAEYDEIIAAIDAAVKILDAAYPKTIAMTQVDKKAVFTQLTKNSLFARHMAPTSYTAQFGPSTVMNEGLIKTILKIKADLVADRAIDLETMTTNQFNYEKKLQESQTFVSNEAVNINELSYKKAYLEAEIEKFTKYQEGFAANEDAAAEFVAALRDTCSSQKADYESAIAAMDTEKSDLASIATKLEGLVEATSSYFDKYGTKPWKPNATSDVDADANADNTVDTTYSVPGEYSIPGTAALSPALQIASFAQLRSDKTSRMATAYDKALSYLQTQGKKLNSKLLLSLASPYTDDSTYLSSATEIDIYTPESGAGSNKNLGIEMLTKSDYATEDSLAATGSDPFKKLRMYIYGLIHQMELQGSTDTADSGACTTAISTKEDAVTTATNDIKVLKSALAILKHQKEMYEYDSEATAGLVAKWKAEKESITSAKETAYAEYTAIISDQADIITMCTQAMEFVDDYFQVSSFIQKTKRTKGPVDDQMKMMGFTTDIPTGGYLKAGGGGTSEMKTLYFMIKALKTSADTYKQKMLADRLAMERSHTAMKDKASKAFDETTSAKADADAKVLSLGVDIASKEEDITTAEGTLETAQTLLADKKKECDLTETFATRKERILGDIKSLKEAYAILTNATSTA